MASSTISLLHPDPAKIREDKSAKTVAFFCKERPVRIDAATVAELKAVAAVRGGANVRICLHEGPEAEHHDMIILEHQGKYYRPHKHIEKGETFHIIEGEMGIFAFDEGGAVTDCCTLGPGDVYRIAVGMYHTLLPRTEQVIYHENKPGPFLGDGDSIYPDWAPDGSDTAAVAAYTDALAARL